MKAITYLILVLLTLICSALGISYLVSVNGGPIEVELETRLSSSDDKTALDSKFIDTPPGFFCAIFPVLKHQLESQEKENMLNLKMALEEGR